MSNKRFAVLRFATVLVAASFISQVQAKFQLLHNPTPQKVREVIAQSGPAVLLEFCGDWCPACQRMAPIVGQLNGELGDQIVIIQVKLDNSGAIKQPLKNAFGFGMFPRFFYFKDGKQVGSQHGSASKADMRSKIKSYLGI